MALEFGIFNELPVLYPLQMRGEAEAFAIGARARAEAEQMAKKAEAFQMYQEAAQLDMLLEKLPQVWGRAGLWEEGGGEVTGWGSLGVPKVRQDLRKRGIIARDRWVWWTVWSISGPPSWGKGL